jgi:Class-II DAHP synthetase family
MRSQTAAALMALAGGASAFTAPATTTRMVMSPPKGSSVEVPLDVAPGWRPDSWRTRKAYQMPEYGDESKLADAERILARQSPLVFAGEVRGLKPTLSLQRRAVKRPVLHTTQGSHQDDIT